MHIPFKVLVSVVGVNLLHPYIKDTDMFLDLFMSTQSRDGAAGGKSSEEIIGEVAGDILARLPDNFDIEMAEKSYPVDYYESMNTVLTQELGRVNNLLVVIRNSLVNLGKAVKGLVLMSEDLDKVGKALFDGKVPAMWLKKSFPSLKPLGKAVQVDISLTPRVESAWLSTA